MSETENPRSAEKIRKIIARTTGTDMELPAMDRNKFGDSPGLLGQCNPWSLNVSPGDNLRAWEVNQWPCALL